MHADALYDFLVSTSCVVISALDFSREFKFSKLRVSCVEVTVLLAVLSILMIGRVFLLPSFIRRTF